MLLSQLIKLTRYDAVFTFQVDVVAGEAKRDFLAERDITWEDFRTRTITYLDTNGQAVQLTCKVTGEPGKASHLGNANEFEAVIGRLHQKASNARTKAVGLEVKNIVSIVTPIASIQYHIPLG
jgi:hypothetical protein